jgi:hypothetical protein
MNYIFERAKWIIQIKAIAIVVTNATLIGIGLAPMWSSTNSWKAKDYFHLRKI